MDKLKSVVSVLLWIPVLLLLSFPLLMLAPFASVLEWPLWAYFLPVGVIPLGVIIVPFTKADHPIYGNREHPVPPEWYRKGQPERLRDYVWRAWRNPVNALRYYIKQPAVEFVSGVLNPDDSVRKGLVKSAYRWTRSGLYSEYWYMRAIDWTIRGKHYEFFEFRIGWKFSGVEGFAPTLQLGPRSR